MTKKEKQSIVEIVTQYTSCYNDITHLEQHIEKLLDDKNDLVERLKGIREDESRLVKTLQDKYGEEAILDLEKLEITNGKA